MKRFPPLQLELVLLCLCVENAGAYTETKSKGRHPITVEQIGVPG